MVDAQGGMHSSCEGITICMYIFKEGILFKKSLYILVHSMYIAMP